MAGTSAFARERRDRVTELVDELVVALRAVPTGGENSGEGSGKGVEDARKSGLVERTVREIGGVSASSARASRGGRFMFVDADNVDEREVRQSYHALEEKMRIFGQTDKAERLERLRTMLVSKHASTVGGAGAHCILAALMASSGQPLYTVLQGDYREEEDGTKYALDGSSGRLREGTGEGFSVHGSIDDGGEESCGSYLSEVSGCSVGHWCSDSEESEWRDDDDDGLEQQLEAHRAPCGEYGPGRDELGAAARGDDFYGEEGEQHRDAGSLDPIRGSSHRIGVDAILGRCSFGLGTWTGSQTSMEEPQLVRQLLLIFNGVDDETNSRGREHADPSEKACRATSSLSARISATATSSLSSTAIMSLLADEFRAREDAEWLTGELKLCLNAETTLGMPSSSTLQAFARSIETRLRALMATSRKLDVMARDAEVDPMRRCPTLLECHIKLKDSVRDIAFLRDVFETVTRRVLVDHGDVRSLAFDASGVGNDFEERLPRVATGILDTLYELVDSYYLTSEAYKHEECVGIFSETLIPYIQWTQLWLSEGAIGHPEFMIHKVVMEDKLLREEEDAHRLGDDFDFFIDSKSETVVEETQPCFLRGRDAVDILIAGRCRCLFKAYSAFIGQKSAKSAMEMEATFLNELREFCGRRVDDGDRGACGADRDGTTPREGLAVASMSSELTASPSYGVLGTYCRYRNVLDGEWTAMTSGDLPFAGGAQSGGAQSGGAKGSQAPVSRLLNRGDVGNDRSRSVMWRATTSYILIERCLVSHVRSLSQTISVEFLECLLGPWGLRKALYGMQDLFLMRRGEMLQPFVSCVFSKVNRGEGVGDLQDLNDALYESLTAGFVHSMDLVREVHLRSSTPSRQLKDIEGGVYPIESETVSNLNLESVRLSCRVRWPLKLVIDDASIAIYGRCFAFLLKLRGTLFLLDALHSRLFKRRDAVDPSVMRLSFEMRHFAVNLHRYVMESVIQREGEVLMRDVELAASAEDLINRHARFVRRISRYCLVSSEHLWTLLREKITSILDLVPILVRLAREYEDEGWSLSGANVTLLQHLCADFEKRMHSLMRLLRRQSQVATTSSLSLSLFLVLDFNGYYSRAGGAAK